MCVVAIGIIAIASCKKKQSVTIVGTWKFSSIGADANGNGAIDAGELTSVTNDTSYNRTTLQFSSNGTLTESESGVVMENGTWAFENNNTYLKITGSAGDVAHLKVYSLTSSSLTLFDTTGGGQIWEVLAKQ